LRAAAVVTIVFAIVATTATAQVAETLGEVRVHGNHTTPDEDVLALAGLTVGSPVTDESLRQATERLRASGRFAGVEVRKRFRSIENPSDILVIVVVDEHPGVSETDLTPSPMKRMRSLGMWLPILDYDDGYGFTYGARTSFVDTLGPRSRISVPLTWGGERRAALEIDRVLERGPISRIEGALSIARRENPHYEIGDTRQEIRLRAERIFVPWLRAGGGIRATNVSFGEIDESHFAPSVDFTVDTRTDPAFPRNAIHVVTGVEQLRFESDQNVARWSSDIRGYVGLIRSTVLAVRFVTVRASDPLPAYEQPLLGGAAMLRGYKFGYRAGDNLAAMSAEVRVPITSPLNIGRLGLKAFVDAGTVFSSGEKLSYQRFDQGVGAGVFVTATVFRVNLDVAWPQHGDDRSPRWHFGLGVAF
jgi:outer membrane protein assembly factor BamA